MIEVSLRELAVGVIAVSMVLVLLFTWISHWSNRNAERRSLRRRIVCRLCLAVFENPGRERMVECPDCGARTDRRGPQALG